MLKRNVPVIGKPLYINIVREKGKIKEILPTDRLVKMTGDILSDAKPDEAHHPTAFVLKALKRPASHKQKLITEQPRTSVKTILKLRTNIEKPHRKCGKRRGETITKPCHNLAYNAITMYR